eukprot:UN08426
MKLFQGRLNVLSAIFLAVLLTACGGGGGSAPVDPPQDGDTTPDTFTFEDQTDVELSTVITSAPITVTDR